MLEPPPANGDFVLQWEWEQILLWKKLAKEYGLSETDPRYITRVKLIQSTALNKQKEALRTSKSKTTGEGAAIKVHDDEPRREKPEGWQKKPEWANAPNKFNSFVDAKESLLHEPPFGRWNTDRDAPSGKDWRRYIALNPDDFCQFMRARIVKGCIQFTFHAACAQCMCIDLCC